MKPTFRLHLLGNFRLERADEPIRLPRRKSEFLLAYLVLHPQEHAREKLAALFWGDSLDEDARRALRVALTDLRKVLGADAFLGERDTLQLNPDFPLWVDTKEIGDWRLEIRDASRSISNLRSLISLYQGDLLADCYDDWITSLRTEYRELYLNTLLQMIDQARAQSEYAQVIDLGRRVLATDNANESAHQHLIFALAAQGDRAAALDQYAACERALRDELGVAPSKETRALYASIKQKVSVESPVARLTNLPKPLTSFIGRAKEMAEVKQLLTEHSLVTLIGAGGSGKTRLALELGRSLVPDFSAGVWWVDLSPLSDAMLVANTVAKALGVQEQPRQSITETLVNFLQARQLLLVLDNCEHLIEAGATLAQAILAECDHIRIMTTSREALNIAGEQVYRVPSLDLPAAEDAAAAMRLLQLALSKLQSFAAVQLFIERAHSHSAQFQLNEQNIFQIVRVCQRLDGIPLAIELAAARTNSLSVDEIADRLDDRFRLLTSGRHNILPRQQTLRALIDWSFDLLSEPERILFRRLAVFAGGWTLAAAEQVCSDDAVGTTRRGRPETGTGTHPGVPLHHDDILDLLARLIAKSLVVAEDPSTGSGWHGATRYRMLETIREYAREKLTGANESEPLRDQHLEYCVKVAEQAEPILMTARRAEAIARLENEHANFRVALEWGCQHDLEKARWLAGLLGWFWNWGDYVSEPREWYARVLAGAPTSTKGMANALLGLGVVTQLFYPAEAIASFEKSIVLWRELGDQRQLARSCTYLGYCRLILGQYSDACTVFEENESVIRNFADGWVLATALTFWGRAVAGTRSDYQAAKALHEQALALGQATQDAMVLGVVFHNLGHLASAQGDLAAARQYHLEGLAWRRKLGSRLWLTGSLRNTADVMSLQGDYAEAEKLYAESLDLSRAIGDPISEAWTLAKQSYCALHQTDYARARSLLKKSIEILRMRAEPMVTAMCLSGCAELRRAEGHAEPAARLLAFVEVFLKTNQRTFPQPPDRIQYERNVATVRAELDQATFNAAWQAGCALTLEQAIALAREEQ